MKEAPKEFHTLLNEMYSRIYYDRRRTYEVGTPEQKKKVYSATSKIIPSKIPFKSIYSSYIISITESK